MLDTTQSLTIVERTCHDDGDHAIEGENSKKIERLGIDTTAPVAASVAAPITAIECKDPAVLAAFAVAIFPRRQNIVSIFAPSGIDII